MKKINLFTLLLLGLFIFPAALHEITEPVDYEMIHRIKKEGLENSKIMDIAWNLTDRIGPRLSGSTGLKNAYDWTSSTFREWGLTNVKVDPWGEFGRGWEVEKSYIAMKEPYYQALIGIPKAWTNGTNGLVEAEAIYVNITNDRDFEAYKGKIKGKFVLTPVTIQARTTFQADAQRYTDEALEAMKEMPIGIGGGGEQFSAERIAEFRQAQELRRKAQQFFIDEGALAIINTHRGGGHGTFFTTNGASYAVDAPEVLPEMEIAVEHYNRMVRLLEKGVPVKVEMDSKTKFLDEDLNGYNVLAEIQGTDPKLKEEIVMLGAHLDSWFAGTGATDNAAGSSVMMEAMRILKTLGVQPRRTIRVALWGSEEQGLYGSRNYVRKTFTQDGQNVPNAAHEKFSAYYNIDNGTGKIRGIYTQGNDAAKPIFEEWFKPFHDMGAETITIRNTGGTDHQAFDGVGLPGFQFIQDPIDYGTRTHHTNMDVYERLQEADLKQMAVIVASMVYHTAMRDEKIPRKPRAVTN